jgi:glycosyltransferase involved in cell wall biosynthesis
MQKEIKYVGFYDSYLNKQENRVYTLAATNKMDYICNVLNRLDYDVLIVSPSRTKNNRFYKGKETIIKEGVRLKLFPTVPWGNKIQKLFSLILEDILLLIYLIFNVDRDETIIVYHSLELRSVLRLAKKIKKFKVILEVEEIYQDVKKFSRYSKKEEYSTIDAADKYIFPTELLNEKINRNRKPYSIIYGTYMVEKDRGQKLKDNKIHVVYAGTFDPRKGSLLAIKAAQYLNSNYHLHIIGFGSDEQIANINKLINQISEKTKASISYDGLLSGEEYISFLQKCDIGLSTQAPDASFNHTSFPSKVLSYLANGLRVVSVRIKSIEKSAVSDEIIFYDGEDPQTVAETLLSVDLSNTNRSRDVVKALDKRFLLSMKNLLECQDEKNI